MKIKSGLFWQVTHTAWALLLALMPTELFFLIRSVASPGGFWQEALLGIVGLFFLGGIQVLLIILYIIFLTMVWEYGKPKNT